MRKKGKLLGYTLRRERKEKRQKKGKPEWVMGEEKDGNGIVSQQQHTGSDFRLILVLFSNLSH